jgi:hypothetical protein
MAVFPPPDAEASAAGTHRRSGEVALVVPPVGTGLLPRLTELAVRLVFLCLPLKAVALLLRRDAPSAEASGSPPVSHRSALRLLALHIAPINPVVYGGPTEWLNH